MQRESIRRSTSAQCSLDDDDDTSSATSTSTSTTNDSSDSAVSEQLIAEILHTYRAYPASAVTADTVGSLQSAHLDPYIQMRTNGPIYHGANGGDSSSSFSRGNASSQPQQQVALHTRATAPSASASVSVTRSASDWMTEYQENTMSRQTSIQRIRQEEKDHPRGLKNSYVAPPSLDEDGFLHPEEVRRRSISRRRQVERDHNKDCTFRPRLSRPRDDIPESIQQVPLSRKGAWEDRLYGEYLTRKLEYRQEREEQFLESNKRNALLEYMECTFDPRLQNQDIHRGKTVNAGSKKQQQRRSAMQQHKQEQTDPMERERRSETRMQPTTAAEQADAEEQQQKQEEPAELRRRPSGSGGGYDVEAAACDRLHRRSQQQREQYIQEARRKEHAAAQRRRQKAHEVPRPSACQVRLYKQAFLMSSKDDQLPISADEVARRDEVRRNGVAASRRLYQDCTVRELRIEELREKYRPSYRPEISEMAAALPRDETRDATFERLASTRNNQQQQ